MRKPEEAGGLRGMASGGFSGFVLDPEKCSRLSLGEKRELVHEIAQWPVDAPGILSSFTRRELLEIICAEMGKERKYSGYSKFRMIEHLLKLVNEKSKRSNIDNIIAYSPSKTGKGYKRQRIREAQLPMSSELTSVDLAKNEDGHVKIKICENVACKATICPDDAFCKRCSCCICHYYDDNKDPSLWITCSYDSLGENSCGLTCHLICALKDERTRIMRIGYVKNLDGSFCCVSCGKINGLMRTWRKQLLIAKEARRVDILCLRVLLGYRILTWTERYKELQKNMETALQMLKKELGPLDLVCAKMARGIVNRLSCGAEVQKLCASAVEAFDSKFSDSFLDCMEKKRPSCQILLEELSPTSVIVMLDHIDNLFEDSIGWNLWHRKSIVKEYSDKPSFVAMKPEKRFKITDLSPSTEYFCKVSLFSSVGILGVCEAEWITPPSDGSSVTALGANRKHESTITASLDTRVKANDISDIKLVFRHHPVQEQSAKDIKKNKNEGSCLLPLSTETLCPSTPCKANEALEASSLGCKKRNGESAYDYSVRVIKWLEQQAHIDEDFRVKFLTWFSLKATTQERRVVNSFVDVFVDDPPSLAGQLIHTFTDEISSEQKRATRHGFCTRLWH